MNRWVKIVAFVILPAIPLPLASRTDAAEPADAGGHAARWTADHLDELLGLYTHLHTHPELSNHEAETADRMARELKKAGAEVTTKVGGKHGVVGLLRNGPGPVVLVRTDMDGLPVVEETGLPYASKVKVKDASGGEVGVMHACGHDMHMTCFVGAARWLADHKGRWAGTVVFVAQPAEETVDGARDMLKDGLYTRFPKPDYALALHCNSEAAAGTVMYKAGPLLASASSIGVVFRGKGGHGAWPNKTVDPIVLAALAVLDFQTIVSREVDPSQPAVLTVGSIHGGTKHNIIPDEVKLQLTIRSFNEEVHGTLTEGIKRRAAALAQAHRAPPPRVTIEQHVPATINDAGLTEKVVPHLVKALGAEKVRLTQPVMGGEDFSLYAEQDVPIFIFWLGTIAPEKIAEAKAKGEALPALHSALYAPEPRPSIATGIRAMTAAVIGLLPPKS
jgi:hippurate hydrolase